MRADSRTQSSPGLTLANAAADRPLGRRHARRAPAPPRRRPGARGTGAILLLAAWSCPGCGTVLGTAASPLAGSIDLCRIAFDHGTWFLAPLALLGGAVLGPSFALGNGLYCDFNHKYHWGDDCDRLLQPFTSVAAFEHGSGWPPRTSLRPGAADR